MHVSFTHTSLPLSLFLSLFLSPLSPSFLSLLSPLSPPSLPILSLSIISLSSISLSASLFTNNHSSMGMACPRSSSLHRHQLPSGRGKGEI